MAHELFGERFFGYRQPAWHRLGLVADDEIGAKEALRRIGDYEVTLEPISIESTGFRLPEHRAILRHPTKGDPEYQSFGVVGPEYVLVSPRDAAEIWDEYVARPIETMGSLRGGRCLFITCKLPAFDVKGDEVENYLAYASWMEAGRASLAMLTGVRVVCMNTLRYGEQMATEQLRLVHDRGVRERTATWLAGVVERAVAKQEAIKEACELLAGTKASPETAVPVLEAAYPEPGKPRNDAPEDVMKERYERYEASLKIVEERKVATLELFAGAGRGMDTPAAQGTVWGLYQAVAETENFRRGGSDESAYASVFAGSRGDAIQRAFDAAITVCRN